MRSDLAAVRAAQDRAMEREGIPMVLAMVDETGPGPAVAHPGDGPRLAAALDEHRAALAPTRRDDDLGVVHTLLTVVAHRDFDAGNPR